MTSDVRDGFADHGWRLRPTLAGLFDLVEAGTGNVIAGRTLADCERILDGFDELEELRRSGRAMEREETSTTVG